MTLGAHLRELRNRIVIAAVTLLVAAVPGWILYEPLIVALSAPMKNRGAELNFANLTDPFVVQLQVSLFVALIISSPVWLWQVWAFIVPGLRKNEKRVAVLFITCSVPLFLAGCWLAYLTLDQAVNVLLAFTPSVGDNIIDASFYLKFVMRFILAFGFAFLLPIVQVALNLVGVLSARAMLKGWRWAVLTVFIFAALMTPTPDPYTMLGLALPMCGLYFAACGVSWILDRIRAKRRPEWAEVADDQASAL
ncbi:Sec-independent protein translocase protein TatC [Mobilicoccus caccae]|uniref:Sec-independent protein translocase protein TatC n=2 Tax=Mobilicoccus caccae TaxID=1859295 RepID=A0ABQ6INS9_9MICO|nr:Sec-independent protein translocase protein TatC [Mobilicoccus caccae]